MIVAQYGQHEIPNCRYRMNSGFTDKEIERVALELSAPRL
jgi:hypothetical protein